MSDGNLSEFYAWVRDAQRELVDSGWPKGVISYEWAVRWPWVAVEVSTSPEDAPTDCGYYCDTGCCGCQFIDRLSEINRGDGDEI